MHVTDLSLKKLRVPETGRVTYADDALPGFGVRVSSSGIKSFVLLVGRSRTRVTIGRYPTITLSEARTRAREIIAGRVLGKEEATKLKFEDAIPLFIASHYGDDYAKPRTRDEIERLLRRHFLPKLRHDQLSVVKTHTLGQIIDGLSETPSIAHHAFAAIRMFFRWAEGRRYVLRSPVAGLRAPRIGAPRERVLTRTELKSILKTAYASDTTFNKIVRLLVLTGQRRGEIAALEAGWIDFEKSTITLPATVTKNKRQHVFPFGPLAEAALLEGKDTGLLFPGRGTKTPFDGWSKYKPKFDEACPLPHWTLHDLRRTFATNLAALAVPVHVTEKLLNHISGTTGGIVAVYQRHTYEPEMRAAMEKWERYVGALLHEAGISVPSQRPASMMDMAA
jgi:integrase